MAIENYQKMYKITSLGKTAIHNYIIISRTVIIYH